MKDEVRIQINGAAATESSIIDSFDNALHFLRQHDQITYVLSRNEERKLVRKIDWILMPLMTAIYNLQQVLRTPPRLCCGVAGGILDCIKTDKLPRFLQSTMHTSVSSWLPFPHFSRTSLSSPVLILASGPR